MIWCTADQHFFHKNIIEYCSRPFADIDEMHRIIINRHNSLVDEDDLVIMMGDLTIRFGNRYFNVVKEIVEQLNGIKILIRGNHDKWTGSKYREMGFFSVHKKLEVNGVLFIHEQIGIGHQGPQICGHSHDCWLHKEYRLAPECSRVNVRVDVWDFSPVELPTVLDMIRVKRKFSYKDFGVVSEV